MLFVSVALALKPNPIRYCIVMKFCVFAILSFLFLYPVAANDQIPDSIAAILRSDQPDTIKIDAINNLSVSLSMNHPGKMLLYADSAVHLSLQHNDSLRLAQSYNRKGVAFHFLGDHNNALQCFLKSLNIKENMGMHHQLIPEYNNIGMVLRNLGQEKESLRYYLMALQICHQINDQRNEAKIWNNIGTSYRQLKQFNEARKAYERALALNEQLYDYESYVINLNNLGNLYKQTENYEESIYYYYKAIENIKDTNDFYLQGLFYNNLSELYILNNQLDSAYSTLNKATRMVHAVPSSGLKINNYRLWAEYYELNGDFENANRSRKAYESIKDSLTNSERATMYDHLRSLADLEQKVKELDLLKTINTIQKKQIADQRFIQIGSFLFTLLLLATLVLLVSYLRTKNKLNNKLQKMVDDKTAELGKAKVQAEKSDRLKTAFLSNISHEVRTPMNAIIGFSNLLMNQDLNQTEQNQFLEHINMNTLRLLKLFENVTQLAKFEQQEVPVHPESINPWQAVNRIIKRVSDDPRPIKQLDNLKNLIPPQIDIVTDKEIFAVLMEELIDNALKFTSQGEILISAEVSHNNFRLTIEDHGIGISQENLPSVFDKFTKFEKSLIPGYDGPGIGLSLVKHSIELLNGSITIDSKKNRGTRVTFSIPV